VDASNAIGIFRRQISDELVAIVADCSHWIWLLKSVDADSRMLCKNIATGESWQAISFSLNITSLQQLTAMN